MRVLFAAFLFAATVITVNGQNLTFNEVLNLRSQDTDAVNAYLSARGWELMSSTAEKGAKLSSTVWAYGRLPASDNAVAFFEIKAAEGIYRKVRYQAPKKSFDAYRNQVLALRMKKTASVNEDGSITATFVGANYWTELMVRIDNDSSNAVYVIELANRTESQALFIRDLNRTRMKSDSVKSSTSSSTGVK